MLVSGKQHGRNSVTHLFPAPILVLSFTNGNSGLILLAPELAFFPEKKKGSIFLSYIFEGNRQKDSKFRAFNTITGLLHR